MNKVILDADLRAKLHGGNHGLELTDEQGNVIGHYLTDRSFTRLFELLYPALTKSEIAEARKEMLEQGGVSTEEILEAIAAGEREWEAQS